jgi:hypothetical protein
VKHDIAVPFEYSTYTLRNDNGKLNVVLDNLPRILLYKTLGDLGVVQAFW